MGSTAFNEKRNLIDDNSKSSNFIYLITILSAISGFLFGYDTGVISGAMILLKDDFHLNYTWQELVVSSTIGMAFLSSAFAGVLNNFFGRKIVIILASFIFTVGAVMMGLCQEKIVLLIGRMIVGIAIGLSSMTVPMYIGEIAPKNIRGKLVTVFQLFITAGLFLASIVDGLFSKDKINGWRYMLGLAGVPAFIQFFCFLCMPESPRWLISKGKYEKAKEVMIKIRGTSCDIEEEFESIKNNFLETEQTTGSTFILIRIFKNPPVRRALFVGCALQMFPQIAGINTVMYYGATIIQMSGISNNNSVTIWLSSATTSVNFICSFIGILLVEKLGRRFLLLGSFIGVIISLCILAIGFQLASIHSPKIYNQDISANSSNCYSMSTCEQCISSENCGYCFQSTSSGPVNGTCLQFDLKYPDISIGSKCSNITKGITWTHDWCPTDYAWITFLGLILYLFFFAPGMGPMPWTINAEIYPLWARSTCYSIATAVNWLFNLLISMTFLTLTQAITKYGAFYLYMGFGIIGFIFFFIILPETKGKTLEEVEVLFSPSPSKDKTDSYLPIHGNNTVQKRY